MRRGEYDFTSSVDYELAELEREALHNGYGLTWYWDYDKQDIVRICEPLSPEDYAAFMAEEQED